MLLRIYPEFVEQVRAAIRQNVAYQMPERDRAGLLQVHQTDQLTIADPRLERHSFSSANLEH
jgi:hypothetical protein